MILRMISRDKEFLIDIARMYYIDSLSQQEIARHFNISRPSVSGLLKRCREEKIVDIRIQDSEKSQIKSLEERLKSCFSVDSVTVVPTGNDMVATLAEAGRRTSELLMSKIRDRVSIGLSWGSSLYHVVEALQSRRTTGIEVIQLAGSLGLKNPAYDGFELTRQLAKKLNGSCRLIQAPVIVRTPELRELLLQEHPIKETMKYMSSLNLALVGLSSDQPENSSMVREGFIERKEADFILSEGGIGHICGLHYDKNGVFLDIQQNRRVVGISQNELKSIPDVVGIACGTGKAEAILGALRGRLVNSLITDEETALKIINLSS